MNSQLYESKRLNTRSAAIEVYTINRILTVYLAFRILFRIRRDLSTYTDGRMHCSNERPIIQSHKTVDKLIFCQNLYQRIVRCWLRACFYVDCALVSMLTARLFLCWLHACFYADCALVSVLTAHLFLQNCVMMMPGSNFLSFGIDKWQCEVINDRWSRKRVTNSKYGKLKLTAYNVESTQQLNY
jgi:hypothetical protein